MINKKHEIKVFIQGTCFRGSIIKMLLNCPTINFKEAKSVEACDMVLYTGGADISPQLYGQPTLACTSVYMEQDKSDIATYRKARATNKYQVGICRGAQLLNVLEGGEMWQDVNHHAGQDHLVSDCLSKKTYVVSSLHHQGIILGKGATLLAYCNEATKKRSADGFWSADLRSPSVDVEAFVYENANVYGVQWHPECGPQECVDWFFHYLEMFAPWTKSVDATTEKKVA